MNCRGCAAPLSLPLIDLGTSPPSNAYVHAERLVRHASRVAERRHLPWSLVHVDNGTVRDEQSRLRLQNAQQLAERLGGEVVHRKQSFH